MTVAASIILAAVAGGIIFVLLDSWQRRAATPDGRSRPRTPVLRPEPPRPQPIWDIDRSKPEAPRTASGPAGPAAAESRRRAAIAATWRWSVPQQPPSTFRCGSRAVSAA